MTDIELALIHYDGNNDIPYCDLVHKALKEMRERYNPKPLTLKELRERDGEPIYITGNRYGCGWATLYKSISRQLYIPGFYPQSVNWESYGKSYEDDWLAYDHPPKEAQNDR